MKKKILFSLIITGLFSGNSFAIELYKAKILQHKEWTTGNAKVIFKQGHQDKRNINLKMINENINFAEVRSSAYPVESVTGISTNIPGFHSVYASNSTNEPQIYSCSFSICAQDSTHTDKCATYYDSIEVQPGGYAFSTQEPNLQVIFNTAGDYEITAQTYVMREAGQGQWVPVGVSTSSAPVKISSSK